MPRDSKLVSTGSMIPRLFFGATSFFAPINFGRRTIVRQHQIPKLPIFDEFTDQLREIKIPDAEKTVVVCRQHNLETTANLYRFMKQMGLTVFGTGKIYSSAPTVCETIKSLGVHLVPDIVPTAPSRYQEAVNQQIENLWAEVSKHLKHRDVRKLIILDDGGKLFDTVPHAITRSYPTVGVEQTRGGLYSNALKTALFPIIEVATSAVKREIESPLIVTAVIDKIMAYIPALRISKESVCGIIGNGAIGNSLAKHLAQEGYGVLIYDNDSKSFNNHPEIPGVHRVDSLLSLMVNSDYTFGCTGTDVTTDPDLCRSLLDKHWPGLDKTFISCSCENREFYTLLNQMSEEEVRRSFARQFKYNILKPKKQLPLANVVFNNRGRKLTIMYGGFPINFAPFPRINVITGRLLIPTHSDPHSVPNEDIQITRSLLALGLVQALLSPSLSVSSPKKQCLNPFGQRAIATRWLQVRGRGRFPSTTIEKFRDIDWITKHSGGKYVPNRQLEDCIAKLPIKYDEVVSTTATSKL